MPCRRVPSGRRQHGCPLVLAQMFGQRWSFTRHRRLLSSRRSSAHPLIEAGTPSPRASANASAASCSSGDTVQQVIERPAGRDVTDNGTRRARPRRPARRGVPRDAAPASRQLSPAGNGTSIRRGRSASSRAARHPVPVAVVALAQPVVVPDRDRRARKRELGRLDRPAQVRGHDQLDAVVPATLRRAAAPARGPARTARPASHPVAMPRSLSTLVEWVSKTSWVLTQLRRAGRTRRRCRARASAGPSTAGVRRRAPP